MIAGQKGVAGSGVQEEDLRASGGLVGNGNKAPAQENTPTKMGVIMTGIYPYYKNDDDDDGMT